MEWTVFDWWYLMIFVVWAAMIMQFKVDLAVWAGTAIYGVALFFGSRTVELFRLVADGYREMTTVKVEVPTIIQQPPTSVLEFANYYHLHGLQVIQGFNERRRPIKTDFSKGHTLVSGATGSGKTIFIHNCLVQWYSQGVRFSDNYRVCLIDLKNHRPDMLWIWEAVVDEYVAIENGKIDRAIDLLDRVLEEISNPTDNRHLVLIIDEVAELTKWAGEEEGMRYLERIISKVRVIGNVIGCVQMGRFDIFSTIARVSMDRRICYPTRELSHVRLAMASTDIKAKDMPKGKGHFVMFDEQSWTLQSGKTPLVNIWDIENHRQSEIGQVIDRVIAEQSEEDLRLKLYVTAVRGLEQNAQVPGINNIGDQIDWLKRLDIQYAYANFRNAGIFRLGKQNAHYMATDWRTGYGIAKRWIANEGRTNQDGQPIGWQKEPR